MAGTKLKLVAISSFVNFISFISYPSHTHIINILPPSSKTTMHCYHTTFLDLPLHPSYYSPASVLFSLPPPRCLSTQHILLSLCGEFITLWTCEWNICFPASVNNSRISPPNTRCPPPLITRTFLTRAPFLTLTHCIFYWFVYWWIFWLGLGLA